MSTYSHQGYRKNTIWSAEIT